MTKTALLLAALLAGSGPAPRAPAADKKGPDVLALRRPAGPEWFGLYLLGKKAGWSRMEVLRERRDGKEVLVARQEALLQAMVGERPVERRQRDEKVYEARPGGRLLSFTSERAGDGGNRRMEMTCDRGRCAATFTSDEGPPTHRDIATAETVEQADPFRLAAARRGTVEGVQVEPEQLREKKVKDAYAGQDRLAGAGVEVPVSIVEESEEGDRVPARIALAPDGRVVEIRFGASLVARAETEEVARRLDRVDLFGLSRVALPGPLPRAVPQRIEFRLRGLPPSFRQDDSRQRYAGDPSGESVVTVTARRPTAADPQRDAPRGAPGADPDLLRATPEIDSDDPALRRLALEVTGDAPGVFAGSTRLVHWVYRRLEKVYGQSRDRASEVLLVGKGDCTEHALLFVALARAAGIPARGVHGLVYARYGDGVPALYWHAWAEVRSGDEWIAVDPTFDQPVADATHIALGRGTQVDAVSLLGALTVAAAEPLAAP